MKRVLLYFLIVMVSPVFCWGVGGLGVVGAHAADIAGYNIYLADAIVAQVPADQLAYEGQVEDIRYSLEWSAGSTNTRELVFTVRAVDANGKESGSSGELILTVDDVYPPETLTGQILE